jgi:hypothetical protein
MRRAWATGPDSGSTTPRTGRALRIEIAQLRRSMAAEPTRKRARPAISIAAGPRPGGRTSPAAGPTSTAAPAHPAARRTGRQQRIGARPDSGQVRPVGERARAQRSAPAGAAAARSAGATGAAAPPSRPAAAGAAASRARPDHAAAGAGPRAAVAAGEAAAVAAGAEFHPSLLNRNNVGSRMFNGSHPLGSVS